MKISEPVLTRAWEARLALSYALAGEGTILAGQRHRGPLLVQKPFYPEGPEVCHTIVLHPPGGVVSGDTLEISIDMGDHTHALLTTPGAGKWYKSEGARASFRLRIKVAAEALLEWLPQENICFDGAQAGWKTEIELAATARYLGWDITCFGRTASGEQFKRGGLSQAIEIRQDGKRLWGEYAVLKGGDPLFSSPVGMAGRPVAATFLAAGKSAPDQVLAGLRAVQVDEASGDMSAVTALPGVLVARYLGHSTERAKRYFVSLWELLRPWFAGRPACEPRIWKT